MALKPEERKIRILCEKLIFYYDEIWGYSETNKKTVFKEALEYVKLLDGTPEADAFKADLNDAVNKGTYKEEVEAVIEVLKTWKKT